MKNFVVIVLFFTSAFQAMSQQYYTRSGEISFFSSTSIEDIEAHNKTVTAIFDSKTGAIQIGVTMKAFKFEKALMQEHFNENYVESTKYPKSLFSGKIQNIEQLKFNEDGKFPVEIVGELTLHGVTKKMVIKGRFEIVNGKITGFSEFKIVLKDFNIEIPALVAEKIEKEILVKVKLEVVKK